MATDKGRLVIGVKQGDTVFIGEDVEVTVLETGSKVNLMFFAPKTTKILRGKYKEREDAKRNADF